MREKRVVMMDDSPKSLAVAIGELIKGYLNVKDPRTHKELAVCQSAITLALAANVGATVALGLDDGTAEQVSEDARERVEMAIKMFMMERIVENKMGGEHE